MSVITADALDQIVERVIERIGAEIDPHNVPVGVSNRHLHLSVEDVRALFGRDALTTFRAVRQPQEFAAEELVTIHGPRGSIERVRAMGPCRAATQVELSLTDCRILGITAPVVQSGHLEAAARIEIEGPLGRIVKDHAAIVAARHLHLGPSHAAELGVTDGQQIQVEVGGVRGARLDHVIVRVKDDWVPEVHLDVDEANAVGVRTGDRVRLITDAAP